MIARRTIVGGQSTGCAQSARAWRRVKMSSPSRSHKLRASMSAPEFGPIVCIGATVRPSNTDGPSTYIRADSDTQN